MSSIVSILVAFAGSGIAGALVWVTWAEPAQWTATERGLVLTEVAATGQFHVVAVFVLIGVVWGFLGGIATGWWVRRRHLALGWVVVPLVAVGALAAAVVTWRLGLVFGPPDPSSVQSLDLGDSVADRLAIDTPTAFLAWALAAVFGIGATTWLQSPDQFNDEGPPPAHR